MDPSQNLVAHGKHHLISRNGWKEGRQRVPEFATIVVCSVSELIAIDGLYSTDGFSLDSYAADLKNILR